MSACVETMFSVREVPWHGLGTIVQEAPTSADAIQMAGLDWNVLPQPIFLENGVKIPDKVANVRDSDGAVLGVVSDRYSIVQNADAFAFTDSLVGGDVHYETAGSLLGGKKIWLLAKMPETTVAGDKTEPYLCFSNVHDGTGAVRVCMTPVRVVCQNTLNFALRGAKRAWSTMHVGDMQGKLAEASKCLELANEYMIGLDKFADDMANKTLKDEQIYKILDELYPVSEDSSEREKKNADASKEAFWVCYFAPDIKKFRNTGWGVLNAASDFATHAAPLRQTKNYAENNWNRVMQGHYVMDKVADLVMAA